MKKTQKKFFIEKKIDRDFEGMSIERIGLSAKAKKRKIKK